MSLMDRLNLVLKIIGICHDKVEAEGPSLLKFRQDRAFWVLFFNRLYSCAAETAL